MTKQNGRWFIGTFMNPNILRLGLLLRAVLWRFDQVISPRLRFLDRFQLTTLKLSFCGMGSSLWIFGPARTNPAELCYLNHYLP